MSTNKILLRGELRCCRARLDAALVAAVAPEVIDERRREIRLAEAALTSIR